MLLRLSEHSLACFPANSRFLQVSQVRRGASFAASLTAVSRNCLSRSTTSAARSLPHLIILFHQDEQEVVDEVAHRKCNGAPHPAVQIWCVQRGEGGGGSEGAREREREKERDRERQIREIGGGRRRVTERETREEGRRWERERVCVCVCARAGVYPSRGGGPIQQEFHKHVDHDRTWNTQAPRSSLSLTAYLLLQAPLSSIVSTRSRRAGSASTGTHSAP